MNKHLKTALLIILIISLISTISYCSAPFDTETARSITVRKAVTGSGFILRKETKVTNKTNGVFESNIKDGERVVKGSSVGVVISGNLNEKLAIELQEVTRRIKEIKESSNISEIYASDEARIFSAMKDLTSLIRNDAYSQNFTSASENALALSSLMQKKASSENKSAADSLLVSLEEQKYTLEQQLGGIREQILSPASGYFYTSLDGLEDYDTQKEIEELTPAKINSFSQIMDEFKNDGSVAKITDTYEWYLAAAISKDEAQQLTVGSDVTVSIDESPLVKAKIHAINEDATGEAAVIVKSNRNIVGIYEKRTAEFEICMQEYTGLYVPAAAIRVVDGITGVYVINSNKSVDFRCVDILLLQDDYYIVKNKFVPSEKNPYKALKLYDNILVNPEAVNIDEPSK